jgi:hypothetical protein
MTNDDTLTINEQKLYNDLLSHLKSWEYLGSRCYPNGTLRIGHIPHLAPEGYLHDVFPSLSETELQVLEKEIGLPLPSSFARFLRLHNGMNIFDLVLIEGLRTSYARSNIDDMMEQPYDIVMRNTLSRPIEAPKDVVFVGALGDQRQPVALRPDGKVSLWLDKNNELSPAIYDDIFEFALKETMKAEVQFDRAGKQLPNRVVKFDS